MALDGGDDISITLLNLTKASPMLPNVTAVVGDARRIEMQDASFDVVFSNSMIEHMGTFQEQVRVAGEIRRIGRCYFVQTPNRYFPLEPHFLFPFFQFFPLKVRVWLLQNFDLGWYPKTPDEAKARSIVAGVRLLDRNQFSSLFPGAALYEEKFLGMTKSFVAYNGWNE